MTYERDPWLHEVASACSRLLNSFIPGPAPLRDGAVPLSASLHAMRAYRLARWCERLVDGVLGAGHCRDVWEWHHARGLVP